jgi:hypothetical protein
MFKSFTELCSSGARSLSFAHLVISNLFLSEAATAEIGPGRPIAVSKYRSLQALVSAVKQGCSPTSDILGGADVSLRLVSFLEETQRRTWSNMRAVLSRYVAPLFGAYFPISLDVVAIVPCLSPQRTCNGPCRSIMPLRVLNAEQFSKVHFVSCLTFKQCRYFADTFVFFAQHVPQRREITSR